MLAGHFRKMMGQQQAQLNVLARLVVQWPTSRRSWPEAVARPEPLGGTLEEACSAWRHWSYKYELRLASQWDNAASSAEMCESETATTDLAVLQAKSAERGFDALLQVCQAEPKQPAVKLDASSEDHEPNAVHRHNAPLRSGKLCDVTMPRDQVAVTSGTNRFVWCCWQWPHIEAGHNPRLASRKVACSSEQAKYSGWPPRLNVEWTDKRRVLGSAAQKDKRRNILSPRTCRMRWLPRSLGRN